MPKMLGRAMVLLRMPKLPTRTHEARCASTVVDTDLKGVKPFSEIPGPKGLPYLGTLLQYKYGRHKKERYHEALVENHKKYGKIFKETIAGNTRVHLFDPDYVGLIYQTESKAPHIPPLLDTMEVYRRTREMSPGLGFLNGEEWYHLRRAVQQMMMRPKAVSMFLPEVNEVMDDFISRVLEIQDPGTGQVHDFRHELLKWNLESSAYTCFEKRLGFLEPEPDAIVDQLVEANSLLFKLSLELRFGIPWYKVFSTPTWKRLMEAEDLFYRYGQGLVDETVSHIQHLIQTESLDPGRYNFLTYLMGRDELSYKEISVITLSLFADGLSTTVPCLIGQIYCLASNQHRQEKLFDEIQRVIPNKNQPITAELLNEMPYLKACIKEGFRFFPVGTEVSRLLQEDMVIGGYHVPQGTHVELNNNMLLRLPEYFEDPDDYRPERWQRGDSAEEVHPYLLWPFGFGRRTCAGRRFAEQEMQVMLLRLVQNFHIEWPCPNPMRQEYCMLLTPDKPAMFKLTPRKCSG